MARIDVSFRLCNRSSGVLLDPSNLPRQIRELIRAPISQSRRSGTGGHDHGFRPFSEIMNAGGLKRHSRDQHLPEKPEEWPGGKETLLVVEDEPALRDLLTEFLRGAGYTVLSADDGDEALALHRARRNEINLVITDMGSPKRNGLEMLKMMQAVDSNIRAILTSVYIAPRQESDILQSGVRAIVSKPYHVEEILKAVRNSLDAITGESAAPSESDERLG